jgi:hypothetical protein
MRTEEKVTKVHFSISGEALTTLSREILRDVNWREATNFLVNGLQGMTTDLALKILKGEKKLVGDSSTKNIESVNDKNEGWNHQLNWLFCGIYRPQAGKYYRPYAKVVSWGEDDARWAIQQLNLTGYPPILPSGESVAQHKRIGVWRSMFYANNPGQDKVFPNYKGEAFLFESVDVPPPWVKGFEYDQVDKAIEDVIKVGRSLDVRGYRVNISDVVEEDKRRSIQKALKPLPDTKQQMQLEEVLEKDREETYQKRLVEYREQIEKQVEETKTGWLQIGAYRVPKAPFIHWCLRRSPAGELGLLPEWKTVCPIGMKMFNDDPYHTDWCVGAGVDLDEAYNSETEIHKLSWKKMGDIREEMLGFKAVNFGASEYRYGVCYHPDKNLEIGKVDKDDEVILVLPNGDVKYESLVLQYCKKGGGVILETGGKLCHLATVAREVGIVMMQHPSATTLFKAGYRVSLDPSNHQISVRDY